jgi:hypothetical protein
MLAGRAATPQGDREKLGVMTEMGMSSWKNP